MQPFFDQLKTPAKADRDGTSSLKEFHRAVELVFQRSWERLGPRLAGIASADDFSDQPTLGDLTVAAHLSALADKMLIIAVRQEQNVDIVVDRSGFSVQEADRKPQLWASVGAEIIDKIMRRSGVEQITGPTFIVLPAKMTHVRFGTIPNPIDIVATKSVHLWLFPEPERLRMHVRWIADTAEDTVVRTSRVPDVPPLS